MDSSPLEDRWILAQIDAAVAPYMGRLPAHEVMWMREQLAYVLTRDPQAAPLLRGARVPDQSGERVKATVDVAARSPLKPGVEGEEAVPDANRRAKGR